MENMADSTDRRPAEYALFALAFLGFMLGAAGVVFSLPLVAVLGLIVLIAAISGFREPEF